jgi:predicted lipid-binding transport protein (Tim44 family)
MLAGCKERCTVCLALHTTVWCFVLFVPADWQAVGPPHKQRYLQFTGQPAAAVPEADADAAAAAAAAAAGEDGAAASPSAGALLAAVRHELFESAAFARLLKAMLDIEILKHAGEVRRFRAGEGLGVSRELLILSSC